MRTLSLFLFCFLLDFASAQTVNILDVQPLMTPTTNTVVNTDPNAAFFMSGEVDCAIDVVVSTMSEVDSLTITIGSTAGGSDLGSYVFGLDEVQPSEIHSPEYSGIALRADLGLLQFLPPIHIQAQVLEKSGLHGLVFDQVVQ